MWVTFFYNNKNIISEAIFGSLNIFLKMINNLTLFSFFLKYVGSISIFHCKKIIKFMTQAIILAAGRGSRLKNMTSYKPKSFNKFNKKRYIDIIIENFLKNNLKKINIVVGYKKNYLKRYKYKKLFNSKWKSSSIFFSLYKANKILSNESCIISYSDIIFKKSAIKLLKESKGEIVILNNSNWKKTWKLRFKKPLKDLESFDYSKKIQKDFI